MTLVLAWPPSINHYWRRAGRVIHISSEGRRYRGLVADACRAQRWQPRTGRLAVEIEAHPPDRRRRDLDNLTKATLDALAHAGAFEDDEQIDWLLIRRAPVVRGGELRLRIGPVAPERDWSVWQQEAR